MNNVNLVGILAQDPELRYTSQNKAYVRVSVGVKRKLTKEQKEAKAKDIDWISCVFWDTNAENLAKYIKKNGLIAVTGKLVTGSYEAPDGSTKYTTDVRVYQLTFLNSKPKDERPEPEYDGYEPTETKETENDPFKDFGEELALSDEDLPFD